MNITRNMGTMMIGIGVIIVGLGFNMHTTTADRMNNLFPGDFTMWLLLLGVAYTFAGSLFAIFGGRQTTN